MYECARPLAAGRALTPARGSLPTPAAKVSALAHGRGLGDLQLTLVAASNWGIWAVEGPAEDIVGDVAGIVWCSVVYKEWLPEISM